MILSPIQYGAKLRKIRRRLRDHKFWRPWIASYNIVARRARLVRRLTA